MQHATASAEDWRKARAKLLAREKAHMRAGDALAVDRRALPWVRIDKTYEFDAPSGKVSLSDLFDGRSQLFIKHFMLAPGETLQCTGCSLEVDHVEGLLEHLQGNDVSYVVMARAELADIEAMRQRMGWRFRWVSTFGSDFNADMNAMFALSGPAGNRVLYKDETGQIFHTYASYARGGEDFLGVYRFFDVMPKGRNENGPFHSMADWIRPRNMYGKGGSVERNGRYHPAACGCGGQDTD